MIKIIDLDELPDYSAEAYTAVTQNGQTYKAKLFPLNGDTLQDGSVTTTKIADKSVTGAKIADLTIVSANISPSAVTSSKIADEAVVTSKLADQSVTTPKIASSAVDERTLADSAVATSKLQDNAVTLGKLDPTIRNSIGKGYSGISGYSGLDGMASASGYSGYSGKDGQDASTGMPTGTILDFAGESVPDGYLFCNGAEVSRATYSDLFNVIGTIWGIGNGISTFNIPDLRARVGVGISGYSGSGYVGAYTLGYVGGEERHQLSIAEMPNHNHQVMGQSNVANPNYQAINEVVQMVTNPNPCNSTYTGGDQSHNNLQPYAVVQKIIKT